MNRLRAVVRPHLAVGFQLAGVEAYPVEDVEAAEGLIAGWLDRRETCLVALEDHLLAHLNPTLVKRLDASESILYLAIPGGRGADSAVTRSARIARMIRRSIGVQITFGGQPDEEGA